MLLGVPNHDDSNNSSNTSNRTYTLENSGLEITSSTTALNSTYDKLEEIECSESQEVTQKSTSVITSKPPSIRNLQSYRQNPHDTIGSEISLNVDKTVENSVWEASKDTNQTNKSILSTFNNLKLDDVCGSLTDISMKSYADSPLAKALLYEEPLSETMTDYRSPSVDVSRASVNRSQTSTHHFNLKPRTTPGKMSTTLITELKAEHCLIDSFRDSTGSTKNRSTPDVFRQTTNDMWKPKPKITTKSQAPVISKIPLKKTPSKYHAIQSPVGKYIHKGISVQSMSKARHACCSKDLSMIRSKSESKIQSKIPQLSHNVRKKLELPKVRMVVILRRLSEKTLISFYLQMAEDRTSTSAISRRSTFRN